MTEQLEFSVIPADLAINAMRDSGYKNTAYALAELIDNAIEAKARKVEVFVFEKSEAGRRKLDEIAVLDDGHGMSPDTLRRALQFGNGTKLDSRSGIGRFGMGLPNSSISQSRRTDIYSWKNGYTNAVWSYLDIEEIEKGAAEIPEPKQNSIPDQYKDFINEEKGTMVVWSKLDEERISWKKASTLIGHTEQIIGRIYRNFIHSGKIQITFRTSDADRNVEEHVIKPVDPLYLMKGTATPPPFDKEPMFQPLYTDENGKEKPYEFSIDLKDGVQSTVYLRFSYACEEGHGAKKTVPTKKIAVDRGARDRGSTDYGKHANRNRGLSIVRADRELMLDDKWLPQADARNRWWGAEIQFDPELDELFGVSNNKQYANAISDLANFDLDAEVPDAMTARQYLASLEEEKNRRHSLIRLHDKIDKGIKEVFRKVMEQGERERSTGGGKADPIDRRATRAVEDRERDNPTDMGKINPAEHRPELVQNLEDECQPDPEKTADLIIHDNLRVKFIEKNEADTPAFFQVIETGGVLLLSINKGHPFHKSLQKILIPGESQESEEELHERLANSRDAIKLILAAYARMESECPEKLREQAKDIRCDWGRVAKYFFKENEQ